MTKEYDNMLGIDRDNLPTNILGLASDDAHRTKLLIGLKESDDVFRNSTSYRAPMEVQEIVMEDAASRYTDLKKGIQDKQVISYMELSEHKQRVGAIGRQAIKAEQAIRRLFEPGVRRAIKSGLINK